MWLLCFQNFHFIFAPQSYTCTLQVFPQTFAFSHNSSTGIKTCKAAVQDNRYESNPNSSAEHQLRCLSCTPDHDNCVWYTRVTVWHVCIMWVLCWDVVNITRSPQLAKTKEGVAWHKSCEAVMLSTVYSLTYRRQLHSVNNGYRWAITSGSAR